MENTNASSSLSPLKRAYLALEETQARLDQLESQLMEPIAIIGMACRFPGGASSPEAFWKLLYNGVDAMREIPTGRWSAGEDGDGASALGMINTRLGGFLQEPIDTFDPQFFGISPREANRMDPQQRLLLEVSWEALENAGLAPDRLNGTQTGVFIGATSSDYAYQYVKAGNPDLYDGYYASGIAHSILSGRVSYTLGLNGPSITVDTACSSSLTAIHLACQSLRSGESSMALAGGVSLILSPENYIAFSRFGMLSPDGRCKAFDDSANGFSRGEGCGVIVLKRLRDARADGDRILALIRGSAAGQDGASGGLTVPNGPAQEAVIRAALKNAGLSPADIGYVEAHGTGTSLGDPIEARALGRIFSGSHTTSRPLFLGSVKTNIGHLEAAAGVAGLMKVALALQHGIIPPHLHFHTPSRHIQWDELPLSVPTEPVPLPRRTDNRGFAAVSSFGFSGTNVHVILETPPAEPERPAGDGEAQSSVNLLTLSARSEQALRTLAADYQRTLENSPDAFEDICFTASVGRSHFNHRLAVAASSREQAAAQLGAFLEGKRPGGLFSGAVLAGDPPKVAFLFTGQGSQYAGMARGLYRAYPVFRDALDRSDAVLREPLNCSLLSIIFAESEADRALLHHTRYTQPAIFAIEMALVALWRSWGVNPGAVLGHSVGAYAAACTAGIFSLEDGLRLIAARARLMGSLPEGGSMAAVLAGEADVSTHLAPYQDRLSIATYNAPENTVISGDAEAVQAVLAGLQADGIQYRLLNVSHAFHSARMDPILAQLEQAASRVQFHAPVIPFISDTTGQPAPGSAAANPVYWRRHTREAVRFADGMESLYRQGARVFLEIGPAATLIGLGQQCLSGRDEPVAWFSSLKPKTDDAQQILSALAGLYVRGVPVDWSGFARSQPRPGRRVVLPTYPFQRERYWLPRQEKPAPALARRLQAGRIHPLLGQRLRAAVKSTVFEAALRCADFSFLNDHRIYGAAVLPAAAYMEAALAAAGELGLSRPAAVKDLVLYEALPVRDTETRLLQIVATPAEHGAYRCEFFSQGEDEDGWRLHAAATLAGGPESPPVVDLSGVRERCQEEVTAEAHNRLLRERGLEFGPGLLGVEKIWRRDGEALGQVSLTETTAAERQDYLIHPALLDAHLQVLASAIDRGPETYLPFSLARYQVYRAGQTPIWSYVRLEEAPAGQVETITGSLLLLDAQGEVVAEIQDICLKRTGQSELLSISQFRLEDWLYEIEWQPAPPLPAAQPAPMEALSLPGPGALADLEQSAAAPFAALPEVEEYSADVLPVLEGCAVDYILLALRALGWRPEPGQIFTQAGLAGQLGIAPQHRALFGRLLAILAEENLLRPCEAGWEVIEVPAPGDPSARLAGLLKNHPAAQAEVRITLRCGENLAQALSGSADPLQLLFPGGDISDAEQLYQSSLTARAYNGLLVRLVLSALSQVPEGRSLRILEVGAGTGGTAARLLPELPAGRTDYLFTDVSPLFLARAREKFAAYPFVRYGLLDVEKGLDEQDWAGETFDVIIAANVIHATADIRFSLSNLRKALAPGGLLVMLEVTAPQRWIDISFGLTEGWWRFTDRDVRPAYPLLNRGQWLDCFREAGFVEAAAFPAGDSPLEQAVFVAQNAAEPVQPGQWIIFADAGGAGAALEARLRATGQGCLLVRPGGGLSHAGREWQVDPNRPEDMRRLLAAAEPCRGIVHLWSLDQPEFDQIHEERMLQELQSLACGSVLSLVQALANQAGKRLPPLWLVTRGAAGGERANPAQAPLWGLARTIPLELPELRCAAVDASVETDLAAALWLEIHQPAQENQLAWRGAQRYAARLVRSKALQTLRVESRPVRLEISKRGSLDNIAFQAAARRQPGPGEVEIRVQATGLNFKDVLNALGMYPGDPGPLGGECAGEVSAVGSGVTHLAVGDPVLAVAPGAFASFVTTPADLVVRCPACLAPEEAAGLAIPFLTAWYTLYHLAQLRAGQRVLIHAAAGGVGLAAVQLAQRVGAEIYATAGSEAKRAYLRSLGIAHVYDSRTLDFAEGIRAATGGQGVAVVLNSLAGDFIPASLSLLAPHGCFLEIGKSGLLSPEQVAQLGEQRKYFAVDWGETARQDPQLIRGMLVEIVRLVEQGELTPLPRRDFPASEVVSAFRFMAQACHIGKIVVSMPAASSAASRQPVVRPDATYLVTGGLGGLGLLTADWLAEQGARSIVLAGRSAPSEAAQRAIRAVEQKGVQVSVIRADVSKEADVRRLLGEIDRRLPPLRGIIHAAGVLDDGILLQQNWARFYNVLAPKVAGAWHLHRLTQQTPLDFFVMYASIASLFGSAGQANHAAANCFLDALAQARRKLGLPAVSIDWGFWSQAGIAAGKAMENRTALQGIGAISSSDGLAVLGKIMSGLSSGAPAQICASPIHWPSFLRSYAGGRRPPFLSGLDQARQEAAVERRENAPAGKQVLFKEKLAQASLAGKRRMLLDFVRQQSARVLGLENELSIPEKKPLNEMGLDSLMAVELRNLLGEGLGLEQPLPATLVFNYPTLAAIANYLAREVFSVETRADEAPSAPAAPAQDGEKPGGTVLGSLLDNMENLSDEEVDRLLARSMNGGKE